MNNRAKNLKRKAEEKRNKRKFSPQKKSANSRGRQASPPPLFSDQYYSGDMVEDTTFTRWDDRGRFQAEEAKTPFIKKDYLMMQILGSICLLFAMGIIFQSSSGIFAGAKDLVQQSFQEDFQFTAMEKWYEDAFGRPLALLPPEMDVVAPGNFDGEGNNIYALPANGVIRQSFTENGRGIYVETDSQEQVEAIRGGMVRFVGEDEAKEWGKVVVVRHYDGGESWYGMLDNISVQLHDHVEGGDILGQVSPHDEKERVGVYYFALKERDTFIDPTDVISLD